MQTKNGKVPKQNTREKFSKLNLLVLNPNFSERKVDFKIMKYISCYGCVTSPNSKIKIIPRSIEILNMKQLCDSRFNIYALVISKLNILPVCYVDTRPIKEDTQRE